MTMSGLDKWYAYMKSHDTAALWELLHPDAVFESPVVHTPQRGRDITFKYLASAEKVLGGPGFAYRGEWRSHNGAVLEFETRSRASPSTASTSSPSVTMAASRISR